MSFDRRPLHLAFQEPAGVRDTYGGIDGWVKSDFLSIDAGITERLLMADVNLQQLEVRRAGLGEAFAELTSIPTPQEATL